jgi:hypothetical protein
MKQEHRTTSVVQRVDSRAHASVTTRGEKMVKDNPRRISKIIGKKYPSTRFQRKKKTKYS